MNQQEMFDKVAIHLLTQNKKAIKVLKNEYTGLDDNMCVYRNDAGEKCAAGCLIPDELYDPKFEGMNTSAYDLQHVWATIGIDMIHDLALLNKLQKIHDTYTPSKWHRQLEIVAVEFKLNTNALGVNDEHTGNI